MTKRFLLFAVAALFAALCVPVARAQTTVIKGIAKDQQGKPLVGYTVQMVKKETGRKYNLKTDKRGEFFSLGIDFGNYDISLLDPTGHPVISDTNVHIPMPNKDENFLDFDLAKRAQAQQTQMTEEQKKQAKEVEQVQKENEKIKGLNQMLQQAQADMAAGNYDQALSLMQQAVQADPTRDVLWMKLADAQRLASTKAPDQATRTKQLQDSVESYKKAIALKTEKPTGSSTNLGDYWNNLGDAYGRLGMTQDAINSFQQAAQANPTSAGLYYFNLGAVLVNTGKSDEALQAFDKAIAADPANANAYFQRGVILLGKAKIEGDKTIAPPGTAEAFNKYLELEPTGQFAEAAKAMLSQIGAPVETSFGKPKATTKKK